MLPPPTGKADFGAVHLRVQNHCLPVTAELLQKAVAADDEAAAGHIDIRQPGYFKSGGYRQRGNIKAAGQGFRRTGRCAAAIADRRDGAVRIEHVVGRACKCRRRPQGQAKDNSGVGQATCGPKAQARHCANDTSGATLKRVYLRPVARRLHLAAQRRPPLGQLRGHRPRETAHPGQRSQ